jgi:RNA polymerase sigma-70 factor, ECF subfamily
MDAEAASLMPHATTWDAECTRDAAAPQPLCDDRTGPRGDNRHRPPGHRCHHCETRFNRLWRGYDRIVGFLRRRGAGPEEAEELVAETFTVAWRRRHALPDDDASATNWLCGVARGLLQNHRRSVRRRTALVEQLSSVRETSPDDGVATHPADDRLVAADEWAALSSDDREILLLAALDVTSLDDLARQLGTSRSAVAKRLSRARQRLEIEA